MADDAGRSALVAFLTKTARRPLEIRPFAKAPSTHQMGHLIDYPQSGSTTLVTIGVSRTPFSMWRGLDLGREVVMTVTGDAAEASALLEAAVLEDHHRAISGDRRRLVEYNGLWAPGYPPHLLFTADASATPELMVRKKFGDRYVTFIAAIPVDDRELRLYDRSRLTLLETLTDPAVIATYPRAPLDASPAPVITTRPKGT